MEEPRLCPPPIDTSAESTTASENDENKDLICSVLPSDGLPTPDGSPRNIVARQLWVPVIDAATASTADSECGENNTRVPTTPTSQLTSRSSAIATDGFPTPESPRNAMGQQPCQSNPYVFQQSVPSPTAHAGMPYVPAPSATWGPWSQPAQPELMWYRVSFIGGIDVRTGPDVNAPKVGITLPCNHTFAADQYFHGDAQDRRLYLRLADGRGWVFDDSAIYPDNPSVRRGYFQPVGQPVLIPR